MSVKNTEFEKLKKKFSWLTRESYAMAVKGAKLNKVSVSTYIMNEDLEEIRDKNDE